MTFYHQSRPSEPVSTAPVSADTAPVGLRAFWVLLVSLSLNSMSGVSPVTGCKCKAQRVPPSGVEVSLVRCDTCLEPP